LQLIKMLHEAKGNGTSMISLILPPKSQISQTTAMLANEYGTASNIKSRVNRQSVLAAITSAQQRLKLYARVPPNGLIVYTGTVLTEDGKVRARCSAARA
jgi:peptide chain release factor subunit 1